MQYKVISTSPIWVKTSPSSTARNISVLYPNAVITAISTQGTWVETSDGWVNTVSNDGEYTYLETIEENTNVSTTALSVGDTVNISSNSATYADTGETIENSVKDSTYEISALSEDGSVALLNFSSARILTATANLTAIETEADKSTQTEVTADDIKKSAEDTTKEAAQNAKKTVETGFSEYEKYVYNKMDEYAKKDAEERASRGTTDSSTVESALQSFNISNTRGIFGMPYQYLPVADRRIPRHKGDTSNNSLSSFGRKYAEKIVARMPLLLITPGVPEFMSGYSSGEKSSIMRLMASIGNSNLSDCIKKSGKYYSLRYDKQSYFKYVNPLCRLGARFLNLENIRIPTSGNSTKSLDEYNWDEYVQSEIHKELGYRDAVAFYIDSEKQISDSFSNMETESQLASKVNGVSEMGREMSFLLGTVSSQTGVEWDAFTNSRNLKNNELNNMDFVSRMKSSGNTMSMFLKNIGNQMQTVFAGGKLIFPKIWSDSSFGREYNVSLKLASPNQDTLSWYLDVFVPLMHLICLAGPRQSGYNGYVSPFLIKAYYKGLFDCDLGLITNMSISRGSEGGWTRNGLPTSVDVSFTIKDLYEAFSITSDGEESLIKTESRVLQNIILMDYIANLCGVNINKMDIFRQLDFYIMQLGVSHYRDWARLDVFGGLDRWATNKILGIYSG